MPSTSDPRFNQALHLADRRNEPGHRDRAIALLQELLTATPDCARAHFLLASLHDDETEGMEPAIAHYRAGLAIESGNSAARNNLAVALAAIGHADEAVDELAAILLHEPAYELAAQNLAQIAVEHLEPAGLQRIVTRLANAGEPGAVALTRLTRAMADAGRQQALDGVYGAGHALKNLIGLAGGRALTLARKLPAECGAVELAKVLEKVYADWASFLKSARASARGRERCDLNVIAAQVARAFPEPERPALRLTDAVAAIGDPGALREAVLNLARNAREASGGGRVVITTSGDATWARIAVRDEGPGISAAQLKRIFTPGFTTREHGSGFGLSIAERVARTSGGRIEVETGVGRGSTFTLVVPAAGDLSPRVAPRLLPEEFTRR